MSKLSVASGTPDMDLEMEVSYADGPIKRTPIEAVVILLIFDYVSVCKMIRT